MLPSFAVYPLWMMWLAIWAVATAAPLAIPRALHGPEELLYRLTIVVSGFLLLGVTPWPGVDVHHQLWDRALEGGTAWQLVDAVGVALLLATIALWHGYLVVRRTAQPPTGGLYAFTRHPAHLFVGLAAFATALLLGRPSSFGGAVLLSLALLARTLIERHRRPAREPRPRREPPFTVLQSNAKPVIVAGSPVSAALGLAPSLRFTAVPSAILRNENPTAHERLAS